jgi:hypothetical protein
MAGVMVGLALKARTMTRRWRDPRGVLPIEDDEAAAFAKLVGDEVGCFGFEVIVQEVIRSGEP